MSAEVQSLTSYCAAVRLLLNKSVLQLIKLLNCDYDVFTNYFIVGFDVVEWCMYVSSFKLKQNLYTLCTVTIQIVLGKHIKNILLTVAQQTKLKHSNI